MCRGGVQALVRFLGNPSFQPRSGASAVVLERSKTQMEGRRERVEEKAAKRQALMLG